MQKTLFGFLMLGLAFTALQVQTAGAQISSKPFDDSLMGGNSMQGENTTQDRNFMKAVEDSMN